MYMGDYHCSPYINIPCFSMGLPIKSPLSTGVCELADALGSEPCLPAQANHNDADGQVKVHMN